MSAIDITNKTVFEQFFTTQSAGAMASIKDSDLTTLSSRISPSSFKALTAQRFRYIIDSQTYQSLMIKETSRLFNRFLKNWLFRATERLIDMRQRDPELCSALVLSPLKKDSHLLLAELNQTFEQSREMELCSKKRAFLPVKTTSHFIAFKKDQKTTAIKGVFKALSRTQMAGELASYLIGLFCGVDVFHAVVPSYVWVQDGVSKSRNAGVFSTYHENTHTAFELSCSKSEGFEALKHIPTTYVQAICLMHMLRGSEDAHMNNTLIQTVKDPVTTEPTVVKIYEIDGEHIMSSSHLHSDRTSSNKEVASMRIWWLGLPQAAEPLNDSMLQLILSWSRDKLYELHALMNFYSEEKIEAQIWRLEKMKTMAKEALLHKRAPINARDLFFELIHHHPTLGLLSHTSDDDVWIYNQVGFLSSDEISTDFTAASVALGASPTSYNELFDKTA